MSYGVLLFPHSPPMQRRWHRRLLSSLAALAVLLNALMPAVSQARAAAGDAAAVWTELCSAQGSVWVQLDAQGQVLARSDTRPSEAPAALHGAACAYCLTHAASFGLLPDAPDLVLPLPPRAVLRVPSPAGTPLRSLAWRTPEARGPPAAV